MKHYFILLSVLILSIVIGCNSGDTSKATTESESTLDTKSMEKTVMKIHDEAMAKMDVIYQLKKQVKGIADSLQEDTIANSEILTTAYQNIEALEAADEGMMSWMRNYQIPKTKDTPDVMKYLEDEKEKIEGVSKAMNESISAAEEFLKAQIQTSNTDSK